MIKGEPRLEKLIVLTSFMSICMTMCVGCDRDSDVIGPEAKISMITPYANQTDMASINEAFSSTASAPWGFVHGGIDFFPNGELKQFQAVCAGTVVDVELWQNNITANWQVDIRIKCNSTYSIGYGFEPMSAIRADGETQLANIVVATGDAVSPGDLIGRLYTVGGGAHVHFSVRKKSVTVCPEPYFTPEARDSILSLIRKDHPDWNMCY